MPEQYRGHSSWCDTHNKMAHSNRKLAKRASRRLHDSGLQEYRCDALDGYWHVGHAARAVKQGKRSKRHQAGRIRRDAERAKEAEDGCRAVDDALPRISNCAAHLRES